MYCQHPAVLRFFGWNFGRAQGQEPAHIVLVTPWMERGTLATGLANKRNRNVPDAKKLSDTEKMICLYGVARALAWSHGRAIIHRDVKPENVFLDSKKRPRVADFGLAKMHEEGVGMSMMKGGSQPYMAPEIHHRPELWSFPADVYAYAIVFWEVIVGRRWESPQFQITKISDVNDDGRPPLDSVSNPQHRALLARMWTSEIAKRPKFGGIAELLERQEYGLPGTDRCEFVRYVDRVKRKEGQIERDFDAGCRQLLSRVKLAGSLTQILNDDADVTAKIVHGLGYLSGHGQTPDEDVIAAAGASLAEGQYLDGVRINQQAAEPVNELEQDVGEEF
jgi:serine/threonine protein kinase